MSCVQNMELLSMLASNQVEIFSLANCSHIHLQIKGD